MVTASLTGTQLRSARALLAAFGFEPIDDRTMVLARIDYAETYWAERAAKNLARQGITTEITHRLRDAIEQPGRQDHTAIRTAWLTLTECPEIRDISDEAQQIYDDIRHGCLVIHAHAQVLDDIVAVGTYRDTGEGVRLYGEDHYRDITGTFPSTSEALAAFQRDYGDIMRPGPAPMTDTERQIDRARTSLQAESITSTTPVSVVAEVPAYAAGPGNHEVILDEFLAENRDWERYTWDEATTVATHKSLAVRIVFDRNARSRQPKWTFVGYETPTSDCTWHITAPSSTPALVVKALLNHLADSNVRACAAGSPITLENITEATKPLTDAGWQHTDRHDTGVAYWTNPSADAGVSWHNVGAHSPGSRAPVWWIWAGPSRSRPTWVIHIWNTALTSMIAVLASELTHGTGLRYGTVQGAEQINQTPAAPPPGRHRTARPAPHR
ncbi:DUF317 domain-containing protein [Streptomyces justiciae]|uniref:DUF317 domain-containing protein n=1 Tax=Streptomyces justiciae TaxID=2780140 RepID=UPI002118A84B|nr:DUF317 domain-containing protein [Streptomyces justiciae]MCW8379771.1 DUF317 domain-containing protein [Streptomyces justiciae]